MAILFNTFRYNNTPIHHAPSTLSFFRSNYSSAKKMNSCAEPKIVLKETELYYLLIFYYTTTVGGTCQTTYCI